MSLPGFDALLVGVYEKELKFVAKVKNAFVPRVRDELTPTLKALQTARCPFKNLPEKSASRWGESLTAEKMDECRWVKPKLVCQWQTPIADDVVWELPYAPAIGHPAQLSGREEVVGHVTWFVGAVENFRFYDLKVHAFTDPQAAVAEVKAEGLIKPTGRMYLQDYVLFLRAAGDKIAFLREYFDPVRAAKAMDTPILGLES